MTDLPDGWEWARLDELVTINPRHFDVPPSDSDPVSLVPMAAVEAESGRMDPSRRAEYGEVKRKSLTPLQEGDVLFAKVTPCMENGKIAVARNLIDGRGLGSTELFALRAAGAIDPDYLAYYLLQSTVRRSAQAAMTGAVGLRRVPRTYLAALELPLPPLAEQHRIVTALGRLLADWRAGAAQMAALARRIDRFRDQVMLMAGLGHLTPDGSGGSAPFPAPAGVQDGKLPSIPESWEWKRLEDVADVVGGVTKDGKRQSDPDFVEVPYLRVANVQRARLDLAEVAQIKVSVRKAEQLRLLPGDVLLNEGGDRDKLGRGWVWEAQIPDCIHQNHVFRARIRGDVLHPKLLAWHANGFGRRWFEVNGRQSVNLASISLGKIKKFPVPVPPRTEQAKLVETAEEYLSLLDGMEKVVEAARQKAERLRVSLLAEAFAGRLVPQDTDDEPASELLARIRAERAVKVPKQRPRARRIQKELPAPPTRGTGDDYQQEALPL
ncbi:restriction endonuclease subunit S [Micromonospora echinospora]|uniref:restriction endonuclease subunit S n=1 Tax=Micromonospora echinospora TaxID=1877 RepID=UPI00366D791C